MDDVVRVVAEGDLRNLLGHVTSANESKVVIKPMLKDFEELLTFDVSEVEKFFQRECTSR